MNSFHWSTSNTKLAACLGGLGFSIRTSIMEDSRGGKVLTEFFVSENTPWYPGLTRKSLLQRWKSTKPEDRLETLDPLHPFLQGLRAEHNYELLLDAQNRGRRIRLAAVAGGHASLYTDGEEVPAMKNSQAVIQLSDLSLVAALGTLGIPVIGISGSAGDHTYTLPVHGHWLKAFPSGEARRYDASEIARRAEPGKLDLMLERTQPQHPLCAAYQARHTHNILKRALGQDKRLIIVRAPGTGRSATVREDATDRVMDIVTAHMEGG